MLDDFKNVNGVAILPAKWIFVLSGLVFSLQLVIFPLFRILDHGLEYYLHSDSFLIHITLLILISIYFVYLSSQKTVLTDDGIYRQSLSVRGIVVKNASIVDIKYWDEVDLGVVLVKKNGEVFKVPLLSFSNEDKQKFKLWLKKSGLPNK